MPKSNKRKPKSKLPIRILSIIFVIASIALGIVSLVLTGGGIFVVIDQVRFVELIVGTSIIYEAATIVTIASGLTILVSFLACCSLQSGSHKLLSIVLLGLLVVVAALDWTGASLAIVYKSWVSDQMRTYMRSTLQNEYGVNSTHGKHITNSWDFAQQKWYCCGVEDNSWGVYRDSLWYSYQPGIPEVDKPMVPITCCRKTQYGKYFSAETCQLFQMGPPARQTGEVNDAIFYRGCFEASKQSLNAVADAVIINGIVMYVVMLCFIVAAFFLRRDAAKYY